MIFGASKGLGDAFVQGLPEVGDHVYIISRTMPRSLELNDGVKRTWIELDLSEQNEVEHLRNTIQNKRIDIVIYNVGIWEKRGFEEDYNFEEDERDDINNIIGVNITSTILYLQALLPNVRKSSNGKIVLVGSTNGLENNNSTQVSFVASKFAIRGVAHALREYLRSDKISVTCINPGNLAAEVPYELGMEKAIEIYEGERIPLQDIINLVKTLISFSQATAIKEIDIPAMEDTNV